MSCTIRRTILSAGDSVGVETEWQPCMEPQLPAVLASNDIFSRQVWGEAFENAEPIIMRVATAQFAVSTVTIAGIDLPSTVNVVTTVGGADIGPAIAFIENEVDPSPFGQPCPPRRRERKKFFEGEIDLAPIRRRGCERAFLEDRVDRKDPAVHPTEP